MRKMALAASVALAISGVPLSAMAATGNLNHFTVKNHYKQGVFKDIGGSEWFAGDVAASYELGLINGKGSGKFDPQGNITVAEAISMAAKVHNIYNGGSGAIANTGANWYDGVVAYALKNGIIKQGDFTDYTRTTQRAELAYIFSNTVSDGDFTAINSVAGLPDVDGSSKYSDSIFKLYNAGILSGSDEYGTFKPSSNITRAEAAAIMNRIVKKDSRKKFTLKTNASQYVNQEQAAAYHRVLNDIVGQYGYYERDGDITGKGLAYAALVDFEGDKKPELYVIYLEEGPSDHVFSGNYIEEIWGMDNGKASLIFKKERSISGLVSDMSTQIAVHDSRAYVVYSGGYSHGIQDMDGYGSWAGDYINFYTIVDGKYTEVGSADSDVWFSESKELPDKYEYTIAEGSGEKKVTKQEYNSFIDRFRSGNTVDVIDGGYGAPSFTFDLSGANKQVKQVVETLKDKAFPTSIVKKDLYSSKTVAEKKALITFLDHFSYNFDKNYDVHDDDQSGVLWFVNKQLQYDGAVEEDGSVKVDDMYYVKIKQETVDSYIQKWFGFTPSHDAKYRDEGSSYDKIFIKDGYYYFIDADKGYNYRPSPQIERMYAIGNGLYYVDFTIYDLNAVWENDVEPAGNELYWLDPQETWSATIRKYAMFDTTGYAIVQEAVVDGKKTWQLKKYATGGSVIDQRDLDKFTSK